MEFKSPYQERLAEEDFQKSRVARRKELALQFDAEAPEGETEKERRARKFLFILANETACSCPLNSWHKVEKIDPVCLIHGREAREIVPPASETWNVVRHLLTAVSK